MDFIEAIAARQCPGSNGVCTECGAPDPGYEECNHKLTHHDAVAATCSVEGNVEYWQCSECGKRFDSEDATNELAEDEIATPVNPDAHSVSDIWRADEGGHWHFCELCDKPFDEQAHNYVLEDAKEPTCTKEGYTGDQVCSACDWVIRGTTVPAIDHSFSTYVSNNDATCTEDGTESATCDNGCGETDTRIATGSAKGHTFENGVCTECGVADPNYTKPGGIGNPGTGEDSGQGNEDEGEQSGEGDNSQDGQIGVGDQGGPGKDGNIETAVDRDDVNKLAKTGDSAPMLLVGISASLVALIALLLIGKRSLKE